MIEKRRFFDFLFSILFGMFGLLLILAAFLNFIVLSEYSWGKGDVLKFFSPVSYLFSGVGMIIMALVMIRKQERTFVLGTVFIGLGLIFLILGLTFSINPYLGLGLLIIIIAVMVFVKS